MAIVSSVLEFDRPQADGRRWTRIAHTDHLGGIHHVARQVASGVVVSELIAEQQTEMAEELSRGEISTMARNGPGNNDLQTVPLDHADRPAMLRQLIRRGFREYMSQETTINRRFRLAQYLEGLPANIVSSQLGVPVNKVNSLQQSMARLLALQTDLAEFVGEITP